MREVVLYPSEGRTQWAYWGGGLVALAMILAITGVIELDAWDAVKLGIVGFLFAVTLLGLRRHEADPQPRLRLSSEGLEGAFGLVRWTDVVGVDTAVDWSVYSRGRDVVVRLRPGANVLPATREFTDGPMLYDGAELDGSTLKIMRGSLAPTPKALAADIRHFQQRYGGQGG
jgi:hypothetical protein